jgi:hypothetical protein
MTGGFCLAALPAASVLIAVPPAGAVLVTAYRRPGDADDTAAFERALATGRPVHVPAGRYEVAGCRLGDGARLSGEGAASVIRAGAGGPALRADSNAATRAIRGIGIRNLALEGRVAASGFAEHVHLLRLDGVEDVLVENVQFRGFQGDGLYLGSSIEPGQVRHNRRVTIRGCRFDGINRDNRNGISVIDGDTIAILGCSFVNCTRPDMPGPIDIEPDAQPFAIIRAITIEGCQFENNGGNVAEIAVQIPAAVRALPRGIIIRGNRFRGYRGTGAEIAINVNRATGVSDPDMAVAINGNQGQSGHGIYAFVSARGVRAAGNVWTDYATDVLIGFREPQSLARDIAIADRFIRCGRVTGNAIAIVQADGLGLDGTQVEEPGGGQAGAAAIVFAVDGRSRRVSLRHVTVRSRNAGVRAVRRDARHRLEPGGNAESGNDFGGLGADRIGP